MTMGPGAALIVLLTLASVLAFSGVAKLRDPRATRDAFDALDVAKAIPADLVAQLLPWVEVTCAALLLILPPTWAAVPAVAVLALTLVFTALVARALRFDVPVSCSCFGTVTGHDVDRVTLGRNLLLVLLAASAVWLTWEGGSAPSALGRLDGHGWWTLAAAAAAAAVAVLVAGVRTTRPSSSPDAELLDYVRQPIPFGMVHRLDGSSATLAELARGQAHLVFILNPHCAPCVRLGARLDDWAARLAPAVAVLALYPDAESARTVSEHSVDLAAWEPDLNVRRVFDAPSPTAVLLGADGLLAGGPVSGGDAVTEFVEDVLLELSSGLPA